MRSNVTTYRQNSDYSFRQDLKALARVALNISGRLRLMSEDVLGIRSNSAELDELDVLLTKVSNLVTCLEQSRSTDMQPPSPISTRQFPQNTSIASYCPEFSTETATRSLLADLTRQQPTRCVIALPPRLAMSLLSRIIKILKAESSHGSQARRGKSRRTKAARTSTSSNTADSSARKRRT
jgi:hypothetical protein